MTRLIDADALYEQIAKKEELARQRVLDTPSRMPNGDLNPSAIRYTAQLDEQTQMKFMIADAPTIDAVPLDGSFLKMSRGDYLIYKRHWLYEHFDQEIDIQRSAMKSMGYEYVGKNTDAVRHGKWREYPSADGLNQCSECGVLRFGESNYCPNCGARMDEE